MTDGTHVILTGRNGSLDGTTREEVAEIIEQLRSRAEVIVHFHGGLVDEASGLATAKRLTEVYHEAGAYPVFLVWRSGLFEVLRHNLDEIAREDLFKRLLGRVLQFSVGKLWQGEGERAAGALPVPRDVQVRAELAKRLAGSEPYAATEPSPDLSALTDNEREQLELAITADPDLLTAIERVLAGKHTETQVEGSRGVVIRREASASSLIDPESLDEVDAGTGATGERGILTTLAVAKKAGAVLIRVVNRFRAHTDHGVYPTVVEELLREFYLANAGGAIWAAMKKETLDAFAAADRGGRLLLDGLAAATDSAQRPRVTLVGHSAGAVYIDNLLAEVAKGRTQGYRPWPDEMRFRVALLAPANTYASFTTTLDSAEGLIDELRVFTMTDEAERADQLVGPAYPRSLLYLISGTLERDIHGGSAVSPILGMSRYRGATYDDAPGLARARAYLKDDRVVLSPTDLSAAAGRRAGATSHAAFDDDPLVLESIAAMIAEPR